MRELRSLIESKVFAGLGALTICLGGCEAARAGTLDDIKGRGVVTCAVAENRPGFSVAAGASQEGLARDMCAALAASVLGKADAISFVVAPDDGALVATLQADEADVVLAPMAWSFSGEVEQGVMLVLPLLQAEKGKRVFGPFVRQGDDSWFIAVRWTMLALAQAGAGEISGDVRHANSEPGVALGLDADWIEKSLAATGGLGHVLQTHKDKLDAGGWQAVPVPQFAAW